MMACMFAVRNPGNSHIAACPTALKENRMPTFRSIRPLPEECAPYYHGYIACAPDGDILSTLEAQRDATGAFLTALQDEESLHRYAPDKWSIREVVGHVIDGERIFACRALWFARGDAGPLPGYDENRFTPAGRFDQRTVASLAEEFALVRNSSIALLRSFDEAMWSMSGIADGKGLTVRAIAWILAGHERHHRLVIGERYLPALR